ncbi:hypothetical protein MVEN_00822800 [Mycena venus]|uniref:F-box domain-containing protein n=1 Tax=Mycena venus TaxID=2733690 RepID=A0A8H6YB42_9AGAR|nr:hypothetical protein MVEN_00822800 [Mycena venus]
MSQVSAAEENMSPLTLEIHCNRQTVPYNEDLPTELLLEIFGLAVLSNSESTNTVGSGSPQVSAPRSPGRHRVDQEPDALACPASPSCGPSHPVHQALLLSQICSSWRQIIIGSPKLWTVGLVDVLRDDKRRFFMECVAPNRLNTLLMPSGGLPVSVSLTRETKAGGTKHVASTASPTSIVAASRWKYFKVNQYTFGDFRAIKIVAAPSAAVDTSDSLRHLSHTDRRLRARRERFSRVIEDRLSRRTRAMEDRLMREDVEQMPFAQLTHLDLEEQDPSTCLLILRQSTNLVFATLTTNDWDGMADTWNESTFFDDDEDADDDNIALPFLEALQVQFIGGRHPVACVSPFFNPLTLPSLHTLDLTLRENVVWDPLDFSAFQMRSPEHRSNLPDGLLHLLTRSIHSPSTRSSCHVTHPDQL